MVIKKAKYEGSPAFNKAWAVMTREMHTMMLAKPHAHKLIPDPDPEFYQSFPMDVPAAALKFEPTKRLRILSRVQRGKYTSKYKPQSPAKHYVEPSNLTFVPNERLLELSAPRVLVIPTKKEKSAKRHKRKWKMFEKEREGWLALRASPKQLPQPQPLPKWKRKTTPLSPEEHEIRIKQLCQPSPRYLMTPEYFDPYQVNPKAKRAVASSRILELAQHRLLPQEALLDLAFKPFKIKKEALQYDPSPRILEMSEPIAKRIAIQNDVNENAFQVPKRALKAVCSKRTKELAKPIQRRGF